MAKRRKLVAPSADDLNRIEEEFRSETLRKSAMAPIAQVAAEAAQQAEVLPAEARSAIAKDKADAEQLRDAQDKGLVMVEVPLDQIDSEDMVRDRIAVDEAEMEELRASIRANGLRLPVELYELSNPQGDLVYGIISGYRRVLAMRGLFGATGDAKFSNVKALVKLPETLPDAFVAMVEENEVRADLSHFERGRIAVISAQNGIFETVEAAVDQLFATASKAKRSKVRSFAMVFEALGDMLSFPEKLTERQGLRLASALRAGAESDIRNLLAEGQGVDARSEWDLLESVIESYEAEPRDTSRGGRPKTAPGKRESGPAVRTSTGFVLRREHDGQGYLIRLEGRKADAEMVDALIREMEHWLEKP
ncbi:chromosome partitioning protein, ParB family [Aliiroseovarius halocynthiae]|uniref:Chromosome partitioning protein ParB n=1 Tax=Aliiroseovarius halocynthiae TaxID=985055 RepID=A0A545SKW1_9RHOB|nr:ParB/RepB/Spo0J family partition protein [Aliiroseovarius halocynthiae]TQV65608.1 chromosome partitioning protein ParB [Aliiroseovarius halocynthiae]SMR84091.1 chromosome partitioning protein, ParB family [Aliiroseovarius halocynthiae]